MKAPILILCCALASSVGSFATASPLATAEPLAASQDVDKDTFRKNFKQAMTIGSSAEMTRLFKKNPEHCAQWVLETAEGISNTPSELLYKRMDAFRKAWKSAWGTDFCNKMEVYFSLLSVQVKRSRFKLKATYDKKTILYWKNMNGEKLPFKFTALGMEFEELDPDPRTPLKADADVADHLDAAALAAAVAVSGASGSACGSAPNTTRSTTAPGAAAAGRGTPQYTQSAGRRARSRTVGRNDAHRLRGHPRTRRSLAARPRGIRS